MAEPTAPPEDPLVEELPELPLDVLLPLDEDEPEPVDEALLLPEELPPVTLLRAEPKCNVSTRIAWETFHVLLGALVTLERMEPGCNVSTRDRTGDMSYHTWGVRGARDDGT